MAAELFSTTIDDALKSAPDDVDGRLHIISTLVNSRVLIIVDKPWDGRSAPDRNMQLAVVSDGSNRQQAMVAVFSLREHAEKYLRSLGQVHHAFQNIIQVQMSWVLLGVPPGAGIMLNPNTERGFRIPPDIAAELHRRAQAGFAASQAAHVQHQENRTQPEKPAEGPRNPIVIKIQEALDINDIDAAERYIEELSSSGIEEEYTLSSKALVAKYRKEYPVALDLLKQAIAVTKSDILTGEFWWEIAQVSIDSDDFEQAEHAYNQARRFEPDNVRYVLDLARFMSERARLDEALQLLRDAVKTQPADSAPAIYIGSVLMDAGQHEKAIVALDDAVAKYPQAAGAHFNRAVCLQMLGRVDEARVEFETALTLDPALDGHQQYANVRKITRDDISPGNVYLQLLERRAAEDMPMSSRIDSNFALAKVYNSAGDLQRSFDYLVVGNKLKRSTIRWTMADTYEELDEITDFFDKGFIDNYRGKAASDLAPIFVLGMPRSGTTLTEQILAAHSRVRPGGELVHMGKAVDLFIKDWKGRHAELGSEREDVVKSLRAVAEKYDTLTKFLQEPGMRFTDKMPGNYLNIGFIYLLFPNASVIHCHRNPVDNCLSCYERLFTKGLNFSYDMGELADYYKLYRRIMQKWRELIPADFILDVEYEQMVAEPEDQIRRILGFCGFEFEEACMNFHEVKRTVTTASSLQVRQPLYKTSVERWKKYGDRLIPLLESLGPELTGIHE